MNLLERIEKELQEASEMAENDEYNSDYKLGYIGSALVFALRDVKLLKEREKNG